MTPEKAQSILGRIDATWPAKAPATTAQYAEWIDFLQRYELEYAERALDELRAELQWRPSMAHFEARLPRSLRRRPRSPAAAPGETSARPHAIPILYGSSQDDWVYCHLCDMAISLEERATAPVWNPGHGCSTAAAHAVGQLR